MNQFSDFALGESLLRAVASEGYSVPTPIQNQSIAPILAGRDLCGIAQTGTGKTAAFALPILERLSHTRLNRIPGRPRVLVLTPTRELASQVAQSFVTYGASLKLSVSTIFGGVSQGPQVTALKRGVDILVATPGRLLDLIDQRHLTLGGVEILVVDEADQMLDLGFIVPLRKIVKMVPVKRQTLFFSATMPKTIAELAGSILTDPVQVAVAPVASTVDLVDQRVMFISSGEKQSLLERVLANPDMQRVLVFTRTKHGADKVVRNLARARIEAAAIHGNKSQGQRERALAAFKNGGTRVLANPDMQRVLVFTRTKHGADKVVRNLARARIEAAAIHGNKSQGQRERALAAFKNGGTRVLVATDIAARGLHIEAVTHVVNYDLPNIPESYVHRIGRTARAGAAGIALSFCNGEERAFLRDIEKLTRMSIPVAALPEGISAGVVAEETEKRPARRGRNQSRRNDQPRGEKRASGKPGQKHGRGGERSGQRNGNRSRGNGRSEPHEHSAGLDPASGLPAFLTRPQRRNDSGRRAEV